MEPDDGNSRASWPMLQAENRQAIRANTTARGSAPPAKATPAGMDAAMAAPGAMSVMLWNRTSRKPIASARSPVCVATGAVAATAASICQWGLGYGDDLTLQSSEIAVI